MSDQIGKLTIALEARTAQFEKTMGKVTSVIKGVGAALLGAKAVSFGKELAKDADFVAKFAKQVNSSVTEVEALRLALTQSGVDFQTFMEPMQKLKLFMGQALAKGEDNNFSKIGIDVKELLGLSLDRQFVVIAEALEKYSTTAEKATAINSIFGEMGVKAMGAFADGGKAIKDASKFMEDLGLATDPAQIEAMNDRVAEAEVALRLMATAFLSEVAPSISTASKALSEFVGWMAKLDFGEDKFGNQLSFWDAAHKKLSGMGDAIIGIFQGGRKSSEIFDEKVVASYESKLNDLHKAYQDGRMTQDQYKDAIKKTYDEKTRLLGLAEQEKSMAAGTSTEIDVAVPEWSEGQKALGEWIKKTAEDQERQEAAIVASLTHVGESIREKMITPMQEYEQQAGNLNAALERGLITQDEYNFGLQEAYDAFAKNDTAMQAATKAMEQYADGTVGLNAEMQSLRDMFAQGLIDEGTLTRGLDALQESLNELDPAFVAARDHFDELQSAAASVYDETRTPFEKMMTEMAQLEDMRSAGLVDADTYMRKMASLQDSTNEGIDSGPVADEKRNVFAGEASGAGGMAGLFAASAIGGANSIENQQLNELKQIREALQRGGFMNTVGVYA